MVKVRMVWWEYTHVQTRVLDDREEEIEERMVDGLGDRDMDGGNV